MSTPQVPSKMDEAKRIEKEIKEVEKHSVLIQKIMQSWSSNLPPICVKVNPDYNNYMPLDSQYVPIETLDFWKEYTENIERHKSELQTELQRIFG